MSFFIVLAIVLACELILGKVFSRRVKNAALAIVSAGAVLGLSYQAGQEYLYIHLAVLCILPVVQYLLYLRLAENDELRWAGFLAVAIPVAVLIFFKVIDFPILGLSYLCFRLVLFTFESRQGKFKLPNFSEYIYFFFFVPTFISGPINSYKGFQKKMELKGEDIKYASFRVFVGLVKVVVLANIIKNMTLKTLLFHSISSNLLVLPSFTLFLACMFFSQLYVYYNFSGFCDIVLGSSVLVGRKIPENFDLPFTSKSISEYWTRWNITLANFTRSVIFYPLQFSLAKSVGVQYAMYYTPITLFVAFIVVGLWHGFTVCYLIFGVIHATGLSLYFIYSQTAAKSIERVLPNYTNHRFYLLFSNLATIIFICFANIFFELNLHQLRSIFGYLYRQLPSV